MLTYFGIGASVAACRMLLERLGRYKYSQIDSTWYVATAVTDVFMWPLVIIVAILTWCSQRQLEN